MITSKPPLTVVQVNSSNGAGGAERIAVNLYKGLLARGYDSWFAAGTKYGADARVLKLPNQPGRSVLRRMWWRGYDQIHQLRGRLLGAGLLSDLLDDIGRGSMLQRWAGHEVFAYPGTWRLLDLFPRRPDIVHGHNLHSHRGYFDLQALPWLSESTNVVLTLHDAWLFTGHCAHSFQCTRWEHGCGRCPDLTIYPAIARDATAFNWQRKRAIFAQSTLHVATPSAWLMHRAERSMLAPALADARVIPNGVDLSIFMPGDKATARRVLGIPVEGSVLLFAANGIRANTWKDFRTLRASVMQIAEMLPDRELTFIALGDTGARERIGRAEIRFEAPREDPRVVASFYQAADVYLHAAHVDNFPTTVLEALACGVPVVATAVGGIPEQVKSLRHYGTTEATGELVPSGNASALAEAARMLLCNQELYGQVARNAGMDACRRFDLQDHLDAYSEWYDEIISRQRDGDSLPPSVHSGTMPSRG